MFHADTHAPGFNTSGIQLPPSWTLEDGPSDQHTSTHSRGEPVSAAHRALNGTMPIFVLDADLTDKGDGRSQTGIILAISSKDAPKNRFGKAIDATGAEVGKRQWPKRETMDADGNAHEWAVRPPTSESIKVWCPVDYHSAAFPMPGDSSGINEIIALHHGMKRMTPQAVLVHSEKSLSNRPLAMLSDAQVCVAQQMLGHNNAVEVFKRFLRIKSALIKYAVDHNVITLDHVPGLQNPSNVLTKKLDRIQLRAESEASGMRFFENGNIVPSAPQVVRNNAEYCSKAEENCGQYCPSPMTPTVDTSDIRAFITKAFQEISKKGINIDDEVIAILTQRATIANGATTSNWSHHKQSRSKLTSERHNSQCGQMKRSA